jgi:hypothetical protein
MNEISIYTVPDGDWQGLYLNGVLHAEGHKIRIIDIAGLCPIASIKTEYLEHFEEDSFFPTLESDLEVE